MEWLCLLLDKASSFGPNFSLDWPLVNFYFFICSFLLAFSCPELENSTMSINCLFFQEKHSDLMNYPFKTLWDFFLSDF